MLPAPANSSPPPGPPRRIASDSEWEGLEPGTMYLDPNGTLRRKK
jgi:hypothetical protein